MSRQVVVYLVLLAGSAMVEGKETADFCYSGMPCFPDDYKLIEMASSLDDGLASILAPSSPLYANITIMKDVLYTKFPAFIIMVRSVEDVQKVMLFARKYDLKVTIQSSGHDYIGRSTGSGSIQINLMRMKGISVELTSPLNADGIIRSESGNTWARVYEEVDKYNRIVVGGSAHTVTMGGYTLGGGHSPMSRSLGLAVDNLLEVTLVTSEGDIVNASASGTVRVSPNGQVTRSRNGDLFWALRGGGGGTFGVVTNFVFKLHKPPASFGHLTCIFRFDAQTGHDNAQELIKFYFNLMKSLPNNWGGYFIGARDFTVYPLDKTTYSVYMLHYGPSSLPSFSAIQPLVDFHPEWQIVKCIKKNYTTFWKYEKTTYDPLYGRLTLVSAFVRPSDFDNSMAAFIRDITMIAPTNTSTGACSNTLIGGKVSSISAGATAVSSNFRSALGSLSCAVSWENIVTEDEANIAAADQLEARLLAQSHGIYLNEPPMHISNWKLNFWGNHYNRLLRVKKVWDPSNFLTCLYCVGSDLGRHYIKQTIGPIIG